ncbi:hypothetical protein Clacol_005969 [Clathrus columnatus]|uniref:Peptide hydrolase n=1 Tax=Clathrus columnatus TaxID=1419009 RepID=A0AAV5AAR8_9AGAM|nr:hypothetical protein Clacol_005969 [Clathrus columnatus]
MIPFPDVDVNQVFYIQEAGIDESIRGNEATFPDAFEKLIVNLNDRRTSSRYGGQRPISIPMDNVIHQTATSALITIPKDLTPELDMLLPRFLVPVQISLESSAIPVPAESISRVQTWLNAIEFNADILAIVNSLSEQGLKDDIRYLSGEDANSEIISRHSFASGSRIASKWIKTHFEESGLQCEFQDFLIGFAPNVVCGYEALSNISETILRAPGADDDGSGTIALLEMARAIKNNGVTFESNVKFVTFAGEEQGLLGSRAYAKSLKEQNVDVALMIQADMLGFHSPDEPAQLGYTPSVGTIEVAYLIKNISVLYAPELKVGSTQACCSDHQSFHEQGYAAMQIFERAGPIIDPMYHNSGDLSDREGYDFKQIRSIAKVNLAVALHTAGYHW